MDINKDGQIYVASALRELNDLATIVMAEIYIHIYVYIYVYTVYILYYIYYILNVCPIKQVVNFSIFFLYEDIALTARHTGSH